MEANENRPPAEPFPASAAVQPAIHGPPDQERADVQEFLDVYESPVFSSGEDVTSLRDECYKVQIPSEEKTVKASPEEEGDSHNFVFVPYDIEEAVIEILCEQTNTAEDHVEVALKPESSPFKWHYPERSRKEDLTDETHSERASEHTEFPSTSCLHNKCWHRRVRPDFRPVILVTIKDILQSFPVMNGPNKSLPYKCAACCTSYASGESLVSHVLQGVRGDFSCRVFYQKWKLMRRRARNEEKTHYIARHMTYRKRESGIGQKRKQEEEAFDHPPPTKRALPDTRVQDWINSQKRRDREDYYLSA